jgi:hypothetical protein
VNRPPISSDPLQPLVSAMLDGRLTAAQADELQRLLHDDPEARRQYLRQIATHTMLRWVNTAPDSLPVALPTADSRNSSEPGIEAAEPVSQPAPFITIRYPVTSSHAFLGSVLFSYLVALVAIGVGLLVGAVTHVSQPEHVVRHASPILSPRSPFPVVVGQITGMVECQFAADSKTEAPRPKTSVSLGDRFNLASGLLEITYNTGARVILQGPVMYNVESPRGGFLAVGKLTARVENTLPKDLRPKTQEPNSKSPDLQTSKFVVRTPSATVTDLGTEFDVEVAKSGETISHVFRGAVRVQKVVAEGRLETDGLIVRANQSVRVEGPPDNRRIVTLRDSAPSRFTYTIAKQPIRAVDLVDVVAGGDGFSGRRGQGINPTTGQIVNAMIGPNDKDPLSSDSKYHRATGLPFVDGAFIPDGAKEVVQVDSAGHTFDGFRGTVSQTWQPVWAGGPMPGQTHPTKVWGVDYNSPGHGQILLHASNAVTFDLEAVRRANPGYELRTFRATAGNSDAGTFGEYSDFWVLVDGQARFRRRQIKTSDGGYVVVVSIGPADRFLTLAATDGGDGISHDWIIFGDPRLEMVTTEEK